MVYVTRGLLDALLEFAREREPEEATITLGTTPAGELEDCDLDPETQVFTHFYLSSAGGSVQAVFGMDLGTPPGTQGRFISHPDGELGVTQTDDLREVVLVAVPPWDRSSVAAFGRDGRRYPLDLVDAEPPGESLDSLD